MKFLKHLRMHALATALLYIVLGLLFLLLPGITETTICYLLASALLLAGITYVIEYFLKTGEPRTNGLANGILAIIAALFLFLKTDVVIRIIPILLGFAVLLSGAQKLQNAITLYRAKNKGWPYVLILALLCLGLGIVLVEDPFTAAGTLITIIGAGMLFSGVTDLMLMLWISWRTRKNESR